MSDPTGQAPHSASANLLEIIARNRRRERAGLYAVCSANPSVIAASIQQAIEDGSVLDIESTSNQVNQSGGYTGMTPRQFADYVLSAARDAGLPAGRVLVGGDHLGPYPWRRQPASQALANGCELVRACVLAGYAKIHLDASIACADDPDTGLQEEVIARRAASLCRAAEEAWAELPAGSPAPLYVIGTEVPVPGGEQLEGQSPRPTKLEDARKTLETSRSAFLELGLAAAWDRVIGLVVQPGVEFGESVVFGYDRGKTRSLTASLPAHPPLVYEAHSTDYQTPSALSQMVEDHFAILKVGPWLTYAFREAVVALSAIEREWLGGRRGVQLSRVLEELDAAMLRNPEHWRSYHNGAEAEVRVARLYSYSDRCRYYWPEAAVQAELGRLLANLDAHRPPLTLLSQHFPAQYEAVRAGILPNRPGALIEHRIRAVLRVYAAACGW